MVGGSIVVVGIDVSRVREIHTHWAHVCLLNLFFSIFSNLTNLVPLTYVTFMGWIWHLLGILKRQIAKIMGFHEPK